jgi:hypothetical protein
MKSKRTVAARHRARKAAAPRRRRASNPLTPAHQRLGKRLLQFYELPEPDRSSALIAWLNSAGIPKRNADRKKRVREFFRLMEAVAAKLTPRQRAAARSLGNVILAKASRALPAKPRP